mmetsp:Transcript_38718/g.62716  ORF Transcript_38718/g.62716 Transcript_38718/m.62716 type:complete len:210 (-) Transcript_38718:383-1012(-)
MTNACCVEEDCCCRCVDSSEKEEEETISAGEVKLGVAKAEDEEMDDDLRTGKEEEKEEEPKADADLENRSVCTWVRRWSRSRSTTASRSRSIAIFSLVSRSRAAWADSALLILYSRYWHLLCKSALSIALTGSITEALAVTPAVTSIHTLPCPCPPLWCAPLREVIPHRCSMLSISRERVSISAETSRGLGRRRTRCDAVGGEVEEESS